MDIEQLKTLQLLGKEKSFSRVSIGLGMSQPTITMRIQALEDELGQNLVLRTGQKAVLTPAGELFLSYVDRALKVFQIGMDRLHSDRQKIAIAATSVINTYVLPSKINSMKQFPEIELSFLTGNTLEISQMIKDEIADIGLIFRPVLDDDLYCEVLYTEEIFLILPSGHELAKKNSFSYKDLVDEKLLIVRLNSETFQLLEEKFMSAGIRPKITMQLQHMEAVKRMILSGMGVGFLAKYVVENELASGELIAIRVEDSPVIRKVYIVTKKRNLSDEHNGAHKILKVMMSLFNAGAVK